MLCKTEPGHEQDMLGIAAALTYTLSGMGSVCVLMVPASLNYRRARTQGWRAEETCARSGYLAVDRGPAHKAEANASE